MPERRPTFRASGVVRLALFPTFDGATAVATPPPMSWRDPEIERSVSRPVPSEAELETLRAQGFEKERTAGREEGRTAAYAEWSARLQALATALEHTARALSVRRLELAAEVERRLPALALLLGQKIVRQELCSSATAAQTVIRGVSERLAGCGRVIAVRLSPRAVETFETWRGSAGATALPPGVRVEPDPTLGDGEWLLETDDGFLDGRIESQIESAWRAVSELFE